MPRHHIRPDGARKVTQSSGVQEEHFLPQLCPHYALPLSLRQPPYAGTRKGGSGLREMMKQRNRGQAHWNPYRACPSPASPPPRPRSGMERKPPACSRMDTGLRRGYRDRWNRWSRPILPLRFRRLSRFIRFYRPPPQTPRRRRPAAPLMMERPADPTNSQTGWRRSRCAAGAGRMRRAGARRGGWDWRRPALDRVPSERRGCAR